MVSVLIGGLALSVLELVIGYKFLTLTRYLCFRFVVGTDNGKIVSSQE